MIKISINFHSFVDLITNSSTELFVLDTTKTLETIKEILQYAIDLHNKGNGTEYKFEDIFEEPYLGSSQAALNGWEDIFSSRIKKGVIIRGAADNSIPYWMFEFIQDTFGWNTERFHLG